MNPKVIKNKEITNNFKSILELKDTSNQITNQDKDEYKKIPSNLKLILEVQKVNQRDTQLDFIELAKQNNELIELNKKLNRKLDTTLEELNRLKKEREEKALRKEKEARPNRKRLPKRHDI
jgi:hypothetical protein